MFKKITDAISSRTPFSHDSFLFFIVALVAILGPIFFIPMRGMTIPVGKGFFILILAIVGLLAYGINVLRKGEITIPKSPIWITLFAIVGIGLIGAIVSPAFQMSFFGYGFETTSWIFLALFAFLALVSYGVIRSYERAMILFGGLLVPFVVLLVVHVVRFLAGSKVLGLAVLGSSTATIIGSWGDLAFFLGLIVIVATFTLELANLARGAKWIVGIFGALAAVALLFMGVHLAWIVIGFVMLVSALYLFSFAYWDPANQSYKKTNRVPAYVLAMFVVSILVIFFGGFLNAAANSHQNISYSDVRPSVGLTAHALVVSIGHNPATGYGPNMFNALWNVSKPAALSENTFSQGGFSLGFGYVPTLLAEGGVLGIIAWIAFFIFLIIALVRALTQGFSGPLDRYVTILTSVSVLYLGIVAWVYVPGEYLIVLFGILTGALFGIRSIRHPALEKTYSFIKDPRASFFGILGVTVLIVATIFGGYIAVRKFASFVDYSRAQTALGASNVANGTRDLELAAGLASHDIYHAELAGLAISQADQLASSSNQNQQGQLSAQVSQLLGTALGNAQAAVLADPSDYQNYLLEGDVYRVMTQLGISGSSDKAQAAYAQAQKLDPNDVTILISFAQLDLANSDTADALTEITNSIAKYPTSAAYELRAQIQVSQNDTTDALASLKSALAIDPTDSQVAYNYGVLLFNQGDYTDAGGAFQDAIVNDTSMAQAYIYLAATYDKLGDTADAQKIISFLQTKVTNASALVQQVENGSVNSPTATQASAAASSQPSGTKKVAPTPKK